jgi:hypothetical protein
VRLSIVSRQLATTTGAKRGREATTAATGLARFSAMASLRSNRCVDRSQAAAARARLHSGEAKLLASGHDRPACRPKQEERQPTRSCSASETGKTTRAGTTVAGRPRQERERRPLPRSLSRGRGSANRPAVPSCDKSARQAVVLAQCCAGVRVGPGVVAISTIGWRRSAAAIGTVYPWLMGRLRRPYAKRTALSSQRGAGRTTRPAHS